MNNTESLFNLLYVNSISESTKNDILDNIIENCGDNVLADTIDESEFEYQNLLEFYYLVANSNISEEERNSVISEALEGIDENIINIVTDKFIKISVQEAFLERIPMSLTEEIINEVSFGKKIGLGIGRLMGRAPKTPEVVGLSGLKKYALQQNRFEKRSPQYTDIARKTFKSAGATAGENIGNSIINLLGKGKSEKKKVNPWKSSLDPKSQVSAKKIVDKAKSKLQKAAEEKINKQPQTTTSSTPQTTVAPEKVENKSKENSSRFGSYGSPFQDYIGKNVRSKISVDKDLGSDMENINPIEKAQKTINAVANTKNAAKEQTDNSSSKGSSYKVKGSMEPRRLLGLIKRFRNNMQGEKAQSNPRFLKQQKTNISKVFEKNPKLRDAILQIIKTKKNKKVPVNN